MEAKPKIQWHIIQVPLFMFIEFLFEFAYSWLEIPPARSIFLHIFVIIHSSVTSISSTLLFQLFLIQHYCRNLLPQPHQFPFQFTYLPHGLRICRLKAPHCWKSRLWGAAHGAVTLRACQKHGWLAQLQVREAETAAGLGVCLPITGCGSHRAEADRRAYNGTSTQARLLKMLGQDLCPERANETRLKANQSVRYSSGCCFIFGVDWVESDVFYVHCK